MNISFKGYFNYKGSYYNTDLIESITKTKSLVNRGTVINFKQPVNSPYGTEKIKSIYIDKRYPEDVTSQIACLSVDNGYDNKSIDIYG